MADRTLRSAAVMAAGTVLSRLLGFVRIALLAAAIGTALRGDIFTAANTIPNSLYILLAGGVFNTVLVPQLVRAIKNHDDGGQDFTNRLLTFGFVVLAVVTVACVLLAPAIAELYLPKELHDPSRTTEKANMIMFVRLCLPQIFFYGAFVLVGQVLNARRRFGPMMWAPIANNIVACASIVVFLLIYRAGDNPPTYSHGEELLLGLGPHGGYRRTAAGAAAVPEGERAHLQAQVRPPRNRSGPHRPKLGIWTVLFVAVNQVTLVVVTQLAIAGSASDDPGAKAGLFAYSTAMLIILVPHGIVTVSLATAALPQMSALAADGRRDRGGPAVGPVDPADAGDRRTGGRGDDRVRLSDRDGDRRVRLRQEQPDADVVHVDDARARDRAVHRAVLPAAHVLRLRGHPYAVLPAVRDRRDQHRRGRDRGPGAAGPGAPAVQRRGARRGVRAGVPGRRTDLPAGPARAGCRGCPGAGSGCRCSPW